ncbi:hypothetical protein NCCP2222_38990 [Sporosarcina sp. NCCP-2222]|uniref:DUF948 domain-containing protein n=1 Tax=Sporosarcina sp. NCCP-2222 TaxID=2935073 RepID=UPI0020862CB7|nr:DUF948 domain-containing protein [Sporosarcina sp. NCCP-2222]GKV57952.1 hypothetical protein NCCP2222_38990 [Sporosarcina sp. NCCP-2222]
MEILLYVSAIIAALSLLLIAVFVIITLKSAKQMLGDMSETMKRVETKIGKVTTESERLMDKTNDIAADVELKVKSLDGLQASAANLSKTTEHMNRSFNELSKEIASPPQKYVDLMEKATVLTETISRIYTIFKKRSSEPAARQEEAIRDPLPPSRQIEMYSQNGMNHVER